MLEAIIGAVATVLVGTLGALVVVWQIGQQARSAIDQNRLNEAQKLKLRVYEDVVRVCSDAATATGRLSTFIQSFQTMVGVWHDARAKGISLSPPKARVPELLKLNSKFSEANIELMLLTERWQVVDPRIDLFRHAINAALHDYREAQHPYLQFASRAMPMDHPNDPTKLLPWTAPDPIVTDQMSVRLLEALQTCGSYLADIQVEMQNLLVGDLFGHRIAPRAPLDQKFVVVRLDAYDRLKNYFETESNWGQHSQRIFAEVRDRLAKVVGDANENGA